MKSGKREQRACIRKKGRSMKVFVGNQFGRYFIIGLQKDDLILESIQKAVNEYGIKNAIITSGIAATYHMRWHHIGNTEDRPSDVIMEHSAPMEVGGISGMVIDGTPHLHCTFSDHERAWAEHLEEGCRIQYVGEISMIELLDVNLGRFANDFGVKLIGEKV
ncbi:MAG: DNA-binding protein [Blautia sp.]|nr:DNA-binding protein [Blautia sp.]